MLPLVAALALALSQAAPAPPVSIPSQPASSLLGGEALAPGGTQLLAWAGYPALGFLYAQGLRGLDVGGGLNLRWSRGEVEAAAFLLAPLWRSGPTALALRARGGLYTCAGPSYGGYAHRSDTGLLLAPGLALSTRAGAGVAALGLDLPSAVTAVRGGGWWLAPTASASLEVPLVGDLSAGARLALSRRWDGGGAPGALRSPETLAELLLLVGYRVF